MRATLLLLFLGSRLATASWSQKFFAINLELADPEDNDSEISALTGACSALH